MLIDVGELKKDKGIFKNYNFVLPFSYFGFEDKKGLASLNFEGVYSKGKVLIKGKCHLSYEGVCDRCLKSIQVKIEEDFSQEFNEIFNTKQAGSDVEERYLQFNGKELDLKEYFRQFIVAIFPLKLLCFPDCKGLCQICGKPLNEGTCNCKVNHFDQRWSVLKKIKDSCSLGKDRGGVKNGSTKEKDIQNT
ncbi:MAG: DUF177 domain-containing protein [Firmicutes bacterium]|nr:DUF177 domain-containing protein [Bacillota bacterium]